MKRNFWPILAIWSFLFTLNAQIIAQIEEDSLVTEINSLLDIEVKAEKYISSASKYSQTPEEAPSSISVITSEQIQAYNYRSLSQLLNAQKGFYNYNDKTDDYIGVRGFGRNSDHNNRILMLLNGHRLNPYQADYAPINQQIGIEMENIERVEIVRGPGSTLYGNNAVHAVINVITKKNNNTFVPLMSLKYGSHNSRSVAFNFGNQLNDDFEFSILGNYSGTDGENLYFREFDTPENNNGIAEDLDRFRTLSVLTSLTYKDFQLSGMVRDYDNDIPSAPFNALFNEPQKQYNNLEYVDFKWSPRLAYDKFLIGKVTFDHYKYGSNIPYPFIKNDVEFIGETYTFGSAIQFIWDILPNNRIISGIDYTDNFESTYKYFSGSTSIVDDVWAYKLFSIYFQNEYQYNADLSIYFGLRRDDFVGQEVAYNPRAGIVFSPFTDHTFKFLYGRSFRAPNLHEANLEERNIARFKKNENLKSEFINTAEFIWNYSIRENLSSSASFYWYKMEDLIEQVEDPIDDLLQYINNTDVSAFGVELELGYDFSLGSSYINYSYQSAEDNNGVKLNNLPTHLFKIGGYSKIYKFLNLAFDLSIESERRTIHNEYTKPIYLLNSNIFTNNIFNKFSFALSIHNVLNYTINHPAGRELKQKSITQPYRNYLFTIRYGF